jgi:hypothetical protein
MMREEPGEARLPAGKAVIMSTMIDENTNRPQVDSWFESQIVKAGARIQRLLPWPISTALLTCILCAELILLASGALQKHFWYDELFTLYLAQIRPFSSFLEVMTSGVDPMTTVFMGLMYSAAALPIDPHLALRLPTILGYLLAILGVFLFVRKRYGGTTAIVAVLMVCLSPLRPYGIEARPYAMLTGFLAMAAACWQRSGETRAATPFLYLFFLLGVSVHYYGALAIGCLAVAEAVYVAGERKLRWAVWMLLMASAGLVAAQLPIIHKSQSMYGKFFWAKAGPTTLLSTYSTYLGMDMNMGVVALVLASLIFPVRVLWRSRANGDLGAGRGGFTAAEMALAYAFLLFPAALVLVTMAAGSGYTPRYGWPAILGLAFLAAILFDTVKSRHISFAVFAALLLAFGAQEAKDTLKATGLMAARHARPQNDTSSLALVAERYPGYPLVLADGHLYLETAHYSAAPFKNRLTQLTNSKEALRATGTDTVETANVQLARIVPLNIQDSNQFLAKHRAFILQSSRSRREWVTAYLVENGYKLRLVSVGNGDLIYLVESK